MRIGIDIRCLADGSRTGIEEYTISLLERLFEKDRMNKYVLFFNSLKKEPVDLGWATKHLNVSLKKFRFPNKLLNLSLWYLGFPRLDRLIGGVDIFFMPNMNFVALSKEVKLVLTVHDLSFEFFPETFSWKRRLWHIFIHPKKLSRRANQIIAVSNSTKQDLVNLYRIPPERISVVYNGISAQYKPMNRNDQCLTIVKDKYNLPYRFVLYLGTIEPRKNIESIVRAYEVMRAENHPEIEKYGLVIAGGRGWKYKGLLDEIRRSPFRKDIRLTGFVAEEDKPALYNLASLFVYPSFFEGFGFPVLEAMKCGIPVITSNLTSLPEVAGRAALLVDPDRPDELVWAMKECILSKELRDDLKNLSWRQSGRFSWSRCANETLDCINRLSTYETNSASSRRH